MPDDGEVETVACRRCGQSVNRAEHCPHCGEKSFDESSKYVPRAFGIFVGIVLGLMIGYVGVSLFLVGASNTGCNPDMNALFYLGAASTLLAIIGLEVHRRRLFRPRIGAGTAAFIQAASLAILCPFAPCDLLFGLGGASQCVRSWHVTTIERRPAVFPPTSSTMAVFLA